jgi:hypothetical protein
MALSKQPLTLEERGQQVIETVGQSTRVNPDVERVLTTTPLSKASIQVLNMKLKLKEVADATAAGRPIEDVSLVPRGMGKVTLDNKAAWLSVNLASELYGADYKDLTGEQQYFIAVIDGLLKQQGYNSDNLGSTAPHQYLSLNFDAGSFSFHSNPSDPSRFSTSDGPLEVSAFRAPKEKGFAERSELREGLKKSGTLYETMRAHGDSFSHKRVIEIMTELDGDYPNFVEDFNTEWLNNPGAGDLLDASKPGFGYKGTAKQNIAFRDMYLDIHTGFDTADGE